MYRPLIIGHRGSSSIAPENTLVAFKQAMEDGADGIEFDVRIAADNVAVVIHDGDLKRTGLKKGEISKISSVELTQVDVGTWFNKKYPDKAKSLYTNERLPTLSQTLELMSSYPNAILYLEMKCEPEDEKRLAAEVVNALHTYSIADRTIVESFTHSSIKEIKDIDPSIRTAALFERKLSKPIISINRILKETAQCGANEIALQYTLVSPSLIEALHQNGYKTVIWTVDKSSWVERAMEMGISAIITNDPRELRQVYNEPLIKTGN
jgi:glycerophosphoryl diester phosphodiesterase